MDATVAAAAVVMNLQPIVSREVAPSTPLVITIGKFESGSRFNIISGEANMDGTIRCFDPELHHQLPGIVERVVKNTAAAYRCEAEIDYNMATEVVVNDPKAVQLAWDAASKIVAEPSLVMEGKPMMGGEDFAEYTLHAPSAFAFLGAGGEFPLHSDHVHFEEDAFVTGSALYAQVAVDFLNQSAQ